MYIYIYTSRTVDATQMSELCLTHAHAQGKQPQSAPHPTPYE